jgi:hypothetical protein
MHRIWHPIGMLAWERFCCLQGTDVYCAPFGDAFLTDPESDFGAHANAHLVKLEQLLDRPCLVLCGEPGIGKSKTLPSEENLIWVEFRSIPDIGTFIRRTLDSEKWCAWRKSNERLTLVTTTRVLRLKLDLFKPATVIHDRDVP